MRKEIKMSKKSKDSLGDRMKMYEGLETERFLMPGLPTLVRLDGCHFHTYTRGFQKPYDVRMVNAMIETTKFLVDKTNAVVGYTQSDEITLLLPDDKAILYEGKIHKLVSTIASIASAAFNHIINISDKPLAYFDCRVWQVPSRYEAVNALIWRELDATKNAISAAAEAHFSHNQCMNKNSSEKQEMLFQKGINFNDYPVFFKRGTYIKRIVISRKYTPEEIDSLPAKHQARTNPDLLITRHVMREVDYGVLKTVANPVEAVYNNDEIVRKSDAKQENNQ